MNMMVAADIHLSGHGLEGALLHAGRSIITPCKSSSFNGFGPCLDTACVHLRCKIHHIASIVSCISERLLKMCARLMRSYLTLEAPQGPHNHHATHIKQQPSEKCVTPSRCTDLKACVNDNYSYNKL